MYFYTSINIHGPRMWSSPQQNSDYYYIGSGFITSLKTPVVELQTIMRCGKQWIYMLHNWLYSILWSKLYLLWI